MENIKSSMESESRTLNSRSLVNGMDKAQVLENLSTIRLQSPKRKRDGRTEANKSKINKTDNHDGLTAANNQDDPYLSDVDGHREDNEYCEKEKFLADNDDSMDTDDDVDLQLNDPPRNFIDNRNNLRYISNQKKPLNGSPPALCEIPVGMKINKVGKDVPPFGKTVMGNHDGQSSSRNQTLSAQGDNGDNNNNGKKNERNSDQLKPISGDVPSGQPTSIIFVISPDNYPENVINDSDKTAILKFLNDTVKSRALRQGSEEIRVDKTLHRSGVIVVKAADELSAEWIQFMVLDHQWTNLGYKLAIYLEEIFSFAPSYTAWTPDEGCTFEYLMRKVQRVGVNTTSWRFVRIISEKGKPGIMGKKFAFIAYGNLSAFLLETNEMRFNFDLHQQKAVIKAVRASGGGIAQGNDNARLEYVQELEAAQDRFEEYKRRKLAARAPVKQ